jgi:hypothetical protein
LRGSLLECPPHSFAGRSEVLLSLSQSKVEVRERLFEIHRNA